MGDQLPEPPVQRAILEQLRAQYRAIGYEMTIKAGVARALGKNEVASQLEAEADAAARAARYVMEQLTTLGG